MKVEFENISKSFHSNHVLKSVDLVIDGNIHAIMGENGAGKSTLMKILTGVYQKDEGSIYIDGVLKEYKHPKLAQAEGIVFIHQELNVVPLMSVTDNLFLNEEIKKGLFIDQKAMDKAAKQMLLDLDLDIDVTKSAGFYSVGVQQIMEIAKALKQNARMIIMDEPTAALSERETKKFFEMINDLKAKGITFIYISHRMEEIFLLSDRISVLRDGIFIKTLDTDKTNNQELIELMVGREIEDIYPTKSAPSDKIVLRVENISKKHQYSNISFDVKENEILGVAGLMGAGRTEVMHGVFASDPIDSGKIYMNDVLLKNNIIDSVNHQIGFITEDRKTQGIILDFDIKENLILTNFNSVTKNNYINKTALNDLSQDYIDKLSIKCSGVNQLLSKMSGGNQQKVVISKWLNINPKVLIMDEPTRGVDVGAKKEIYDIMKELCEKNNMAIVLVSSEMSEIVGMSDRVLVLHENKQAGILNKEQVNQENIMILATGGKI